MSLELIVGTTLRRVMALHEQLGTRIPVEVVVFVALELAKALEHIHEMTEADGLPMCIVHRDLTPTNVLLSTAGEVKLSDFGIATVMSEERTRTGKALGKANYIAPEHADGLTIDHRSDLFSLGVVMFEMLTRTRPYQAASLVDTLRNAIEGRKQNLRALAPETPEALVQIVESLIASKADDRIDSAEELLRALGKLRFDGTAAHLDLRMLVGEAMALPPEGEDEEPSRSGPRPTTRTHPAPELEAKIAALEIAPAPEPVLRVHRVWRPDGSGEQLVAIYPPQPGQRPGMETALVWTRFAPAHAGTKRGTERALVDLLGEPEQRTFRMWALPGDGGV